MAFYIDGVNNAGDEVMKNADKSAMPSQALGTDGLPTHEAEFGLTKREMMAMHMMAARISIPGAPDDEFDAKRAVAATDALLAELEKSQ